jgi:hypothetical protein
VSKVKFVVAQPGGGAKEEVRTGNGQGWLVLGFSYDEEGARSKTDEKKSAADGYVIDLLKKDPEFWEKFVRLVQHPHVQAAIVGSQHPDQLTLDV